MRSSPSRELTLAVLVAAAAGALGLFAASQPWLRVTVTRAAPLPPSELALPGGDVAPLVPALMIVVLAGAAGLLATARLGRVAVGAVVLASGTGTVAAALPWLRALSPAAAAEVAAGAGLPAGAVATSGTATPYLSLVAGLLGALTGAAAVLRARRWPRLGARYQRDRAPGADEAQSPRPGEAPAADSEPASGEPTEKELWDALDRGLDPTRDG